MRERLRKLLCAGLGAAMIMAAAPYAVFADEGGSGAARPPLINLTFDDDDGLYTLEGGASTTAGRNGNALSLSGSNQYADITKAAEALSDLSGDFSISVWVMPDKVETWARVYDLGNDTTRYAFLAPSNGAVTRFAIKKSDADGEQVIDAGKAITAGEWHNIIVTRNGGVSTIYLDGLKSGETDAVKYEFSDFGTLTSCYLGKSQFAADKYFDGLIDDFIVYGYGIDDLKAQEIAAEAYERESNKLVEQFNSLVVDTHFYDSATNKEIFTYTDDITVKAVSEIKNYRKSAAAVPVGTGFEIQAVKDGGEPEITYIDIPEGGYATFTDTFSGADVSEYNLKLKEVIGENENTSEIGTIVKSDVIFPEKTPDDTYGTTLAAHDPSIFKDPETGIYYAYNSGNALSGGSYELPDGGSAVDTYPIDTFKSEDLIHWYRIDNNFRIPESMTEYMNEIFVPKGSTANADAWAPDIFYAKEDTEHPYWLYYSLSTNGSAFDYIRSAIGLVKGESPTGPWTDCGVVISSQEDYNTNAIDANIYEDANGDRFFIWGSFQKGIHQLKLREDGLAEGIDYTSNAAIHSSSKTGTRLFSTPGGIEGPEGPYMIDNSDAGYRYMFTSYGDLAINYNIRIARSSLSNTWAAETSSNAHHKLLDQQGRKVGTTFAEQSDKTVLWGYKMLGSYQLGDGLTYYGNGHNSVLHDDDGNWYLAEHCRKQQGGYAVLQVRKMLWTDEGWPVVSPLVYAGEDEQQIPEELLYGTWDLSSVGQTILGNGATTVNDFSHRADVDMPVLSTQIILNKGGKLGNDLGTWEYDGDHTVTLKFTKDGDTDKYEFYKNGDTMKLFALTGYDKDKHESAIVMTGTDQNSIANFAKKNNAAQSITQADSSDVIIPVAIEKSAGGNPILGFDASGDTLYAGDPAATVVGDTVYIIAGHDTATTEDYQMPDWVCYSSKDMKTWKYEGIAMEESSISWVNDRVSAWASQMTEYKGKYYLYYCAETKHSTYGGKSIGVAVADNPAGPYKDIGKPLIVGNFTPDSSPWNDIDPTVWVETVGGVERRYLCWGNSKLFICELNEDMISVKDIDGDGNIAFGTDVVEQTVTGAPASFTEAPWIYRQKDENGNYTDKYYLFYAMGWREQMAYAVADNLTNADGTLNTEWKYGGLLMPPTATSNTNHPAVIDFNGHTYFIYHNGSLPWGSGFRRSVCVEEFEINADGTIDPIQETSTGLTGTASHIMQGDDYVVHENFVNPSGDDAYPIVKPVSVGAAIADPLDTEWEIVNGKADENNEYYVSIQSVNKPGLYLSAQDNGAVALTQDAAQNDTATKKRMTFKTVKGLNGAEGGVTFESVSREGYYLTNADGALMLTIGSDADACTFNISKADETPITGTLAKITDTWHNNESGAHFYLNNAVIYGNVDVYAAEFASNGELLGVSAKRSIPVTSMRQSVKIDYTRKAMDSALKIFVWKGMEPVAEAASVTASENPYKVPEGYTSRFEFENSLTDSVSGAVGTVAPTNIDGTTTASAEYADGYNGKAVSFQGSGSAGINLGKVITNPKYTIAFRVKANEFTFGTAGVFINSGTKSSEDWLSAPFGSQTGGNTMIWSKRGSDNHVSLTSSGKMSELVWHHVAVAANGDGTASLYIDGVKTGSGNVANVVTADTVTYLGVNFWDTPFNGLIDDLYIYNGQTLTDSEITNLCEATNK